MRASVMRADEPSRAGPIPQGAGAAAGRRWPAWGRALASMALLYHMAAILAGSLAVHPCSEVERRAAGAFKTYYELINQGYGYHYYARLDTTADPRQPRPWGTPVITAELEFERGPGEPARETVRLPDRRASWPRLRHQRQLDLAYHLAADPKWAASYARHLCKTRGCARVTVFTQQHHIPDLARVRDAATNPAAARVDLEAESTYGPRVKLGEFRCADF